MSAEVGGMLEWWWCFPVSLMETALPNSLGNTGEYRDHSRPVPNFGLVYMCIYVHAHTYTPLDSLLFPHYKETKGIQLSRNRQLEKEKVVILGQVRTEISGCSASLPTAPVGKAALSRSSPNFAVTFTASVVWKTFSGISACPCWLMLAFLWHLCVMAAALLLEHNPAYICFSASDFWLKKA